MSEPAETQDAQTMFVLPPTRKFKVLRPFEVPEFVFSHTIGHTDVVVAFYDYEVNKRYRSRLADVPAIDSRVY